MGGGARKRRQAAAEEQSRIASSQERAAAQNLRGELQNRRSILGTGLPETMERARIGATDLRETGGYKPEEISPIRAGYSEFAETGGFSPEEKNQFLRKATSPIAAMYSRSQDELRRKSSLQGGGGFGAANSRLLRNQASAASEASLGANVALAEQVRTGRMAGLGGLERTAESIRAGRLAGQDALQRYTEFGTEALNNVDILDLRNRLQTGQITQNDAQLLAMIASQDKSLFDNIMQGISAIGGATAGVLGAV